MAQNKGDTLYIVLDYLVDGEPLDDAQFDEIELYVGKNRYLLTNGQIVWDSNLGKYCVFVTQADSFKLDTQSEYQLRLRKDDEVISTRIKRLFVGETISREEI